MIQVKHFKGHRFEEDTNEWLDNHREYVIKDVKYTCNDKYGHSNVLIIYEAVDEKVEK